MHPVKLQLVSPRGLTNTKTSISNGGCCREVLENCFLLAGMIYYIQARGCEGKPLSTDWQLLFPYDNT